MAEGIEAERHEPSGLATGEVKIDDGTGRFNVFPGACGDFFFFRGIFQYRNKKMFLCTSGYSLGRIEGG